VSDWNDFLDAKLALDLTVEEHRLADALARNLLGFARREDHIGDRLLLKAARFNDRRSLVKAQEGLMRKGLVYIEKPETSGRGHRTFYRLLVGETRGVERAFAPDKETRGEERAITAETRGETRGVDRARIKQGNYTKALLDGDVGATAHQVDDARAKDSTALTPAEEAEIDRLWAETAPQTRKPPWA
jgi:hypothetical protein